MEKYKYRDYDEYKTAQIEANEKKLDRVWAVKGIMDDLAAYIRKHIPEPRFGLCHGTRNGKEQLWLREALGIEVIGTEISPTATRFPYTIQWDFHEVKPEWIGNVDFIFSNSLDHSYDPEHCLGQWMRCLKPEGLCIIEWTPDDVKSKRSDPFGATLEEYIALIENSYKLFDHLHYDADDIGDPGDDDASRAGLNYRVDRHYLMAAHK